MRDVGQGKLGNRDDASGVALHAEFALEDRNGGRSARALHALLFELGGSDQRSHAEHTDCGTGDDGESVRFHASSLQRSALVVKLNRFADAHFETVRALAFGQCFRVAQRVRFERLSRFANGVPNQDNPYVVMLVAVDRGDFHNERV